MTDFSESPMPDFFMGEGDSLPERSSILTVDGLPIDLTGFTATMKVARDDLTEAAVSMPVTIDPDQVNNKGKVTWKFFVAGTSRRGLYDAKMKLADGSGERISFDSDRMLLILVTPDPGPG